MNQYHRFSINNLEEADNALSIFSKMPLLYRPEKLPLHPKDISLYHIVVQHSSPKRTIRNILRDPGPGRREEPHFEGKLEPEHDVPGDMTPSSIEDELTHEEPRPAVRATTDSIRGEISKRQASKYRGTTDMKELNEAIEEAKYRYSYLHAIHRLIPQRVTNKPDLDLINRAMQYLFQNYKILYHLLIKARSNMPESQNSPETTQPKPVSQPEPEPATVKYNLPRHQNRETAPETQNRQETAASDTRQDIMKRMREHRDKQ